MTKNLSPQNIEYYYKKNRFINLLLSSKKWLDLIWSKEAFISFILACLFSFVINKVYNTLNIKDFCSIASVGLITISAGFLSMLGFVVGGLAIISGTVSNKILYNINSDGKFQYIMNILFGFYFTGALIGLNLVMFLLAYLCFYTNWPISELRLYLLSFVVGYFFWFTVIYAIMLLGTCLRLLILSYRYNYDE